MKYNPFKFLANPCCRYVESEMIIVQARPNYAMVIGVPVVALLVVIMFGTPLFEGNDDTGLAMVGAGFGIAVEPEPHLIFAHFGYGIFLNFISMLVGSHAHGWTTLAALGLSMALFARALCEHRQGFSWLLGCALIGGISCVFVRALLDPQFTITAAVLFGAAIGCWLTVLRDGARSPGLSAAIYGALILSFLIRPASALLGLVVAGPALIWLAWLGPANSRQPTRRLMIAIAAISLLIYLTDKAAYDFSTDWRNAMEYNQLRALFNDYYRIPWIPGSPEYSKVGWSANDHAMFMNWYSLHPIFDYHNIKYLAQTLLLQAPFLVLSGVGAWLTAIWGSPLLVAIVAVQFLLWVLLPRHRVFIVLIAIGSFAALIVSGLTGRPPVFRVLFSAMSIAALCTLPLLLAADAGLSLFRKLGTGLLVGIGLYAGSIAVRAHEARVKQATAYRTGLAEAKLDFSGTVVSWGSELQWESLITPMKIHAPLDRSTILSIGLFARMPMTHATLQRLGIDDLGATLCTQPDVRLIASATKVGMLRTFCEERYHSRPTYSLVFNHANTAIFLSGQPDL